MTTEENYNQLVGKTVAYICKSTEEDFTVYGLVFTDDTRAWILRDSEGSGPGYLDI